MLQATAIALILLSFIASFMSVRSYHAEQIAQQKRLEAESLLGFMVGEFADKLRSVKRMDLLDGISNKALEYFTNQADEGNALFSFTDQKAEFNNRFQYAQTLEAMGEVAYSRGKTDEAFTAFENARTRLEALLKIQPNNLELLTLAGANAFWLGQLHYDRNDYAATEPLFKKYHTYSEKMYSLAPNDFNSIMELSYSHNSLGSLHTNLFNYNEAKTSFTLSLELKNKALELKPNNKNLLRDRADTISWLAKTEENLGNFNAALTMLESASNELNNLLVKYPSDASLLTDLANTSIQQSYLLSYFSNKQRAYTTAKQATEAINKARLQDPKNNNFQNMYHQLLAFQLMLSDNLKMDNRIEDIIIFIKKKSLSDKKIVNTQISLTHYFIKIKSWQKAQELLDKIENKVESKIVLTRINLIKAKLAVNKKARITFCEQAITTMSEIRKTTQSVKITYPLVQAYTCLNRENEISEIKANLVKLGINNFKL